MQYSISDLEQLSGVSVHNIRIWERRYKALEPARSEGNTRVYSDEQLKRLLGINMLYQAGNKISGICSLSEVELNLQIQGISDDELSESTLAYLISDLIRHTLDFDEPRLSKTIADCFVRFGVADTYKSVIYPLLKRVGMLWLNATLCPSQEHFLSSIIRQKLFAAIDQCTVKPGKHQEHWLLFLPGDEGHDIGLLLTSFLLRQAGMRVTYLGAHVPLSVLASAVSTVHPDKLFFFMSRIRPLNNAQNYVDELAKAVPVQQIYLSGNPGLLSKIDLTSQFIWMRQLEDFENILKS